MAAVNSHCEHLQWTVTMNSLHEWLVILTSSTTDIHNTNFASAVFKWGASVSRPQNSCAVKHLQAMAPNKCAASGNGNTSKTHSYMHLLKLLTWGNIWLSIEASIDGLHTAQNNEAKWHGAICCHSANKRRFVVCLENETQNANNCLLCNKFGPI